MCHLGLYSSYRKKEQHLKCGGLYNYNEEYNYHTGHFTGISYENVTLVLPLLYRSMQDCVFRKKGIIFVPKKSGQRVDMLG